MSDMELVLNMLVEATTTGISKQEKPAGFEESRKIARRGGSVAGRARQDIEAEMGYPLSLLKMPQISGNSLPTLWRTPSAYRSISTRKRQTTKRRTDVYK